MSAPPSESDSVPLPRGAKARRVGTNHVQKNYANNNKRTNLYSVI